MSEVISGKVLVLGRGTRSFLGVVRSLGRRGITVHIAGCAPDDPATSSRYVTKVHQLGDWSVNSEAWYAKLEHLMNDEKFDVVVPTNDPSILPLHQHRVELENIGRVYLINNTAFEIANSKQATTELARNLSISVPSEQLIESRLQVRDLLSSLKQWPVVLKPSESYSLSRVNKKREVVCAETPERCEKILSSMLDTGPVLVQQFFRGVGIGVEFLAVEGKIVYSFQHRRLHEGLHGGQSSYRISESVNLELLAATQKVLNALEYTGVGMMEFKWNPHDNSWVLLELNARFWGSLPLAIAAGADFPFFLYEYLVNGKTEFNQEYRVGLRCRDLVKDFKWFLRNIRSDHSNPNLLTVPIIWSFFEWGNLLLLRDRIDSLTLDDWQPARKEMWQFVSDTFSRLRIYWYRKKRKLGIGHPGTSSILNSLQGAQHIVFVCKGNICRSPFAEQLLKSQMGSNVKIESAGYFPVAGRESPAAAQTSAQQWNISLAEHRSQILDEKLVNNADVLYVFDEDNFETVYRQFPQARPKLHRLGHLVGQGEYEIEDPYSGSIERFMGIYRQIEFALQQIRQNTASDCLKVDSNRSNSKLNFS